jgi:hypothetical protein
MAARIEFPWPMPEPGVAVVYVMYVGSTTHLHSRLVNHRCSTPFWSAVAGVAWTTTTWADRWVDEARAIRDLRPAYNVHHNPRADGAGPFTSREVLALLPGLTYRQLQHWVHNGYVTPSVNVGRGSGTRHRFSALDVAAVRSVQQAMSDVFAELDSCRSGEVFAAATAANLTPATTEAAAA